MTGCVIVPDCPLGQLPALVDVSNGDGGLQAQADLSIVVVTAHDGGVAFCVVVTLPP